MDYFCVKNFERFQHYKDRAPPWIKLYNELLDNYEFARLQDASKSHLILIWLLASRHSNKLPWDQKWIAARINATSAVNLDEIEKHGFISKISDVGNASESLANGKQSDGLEREGELEKETEKKEYLELAGWMFSLIRKLNPKHREPKLSDWANDIRLIVERDHRTPDEIRGLFAWANGDAFWKANILSPGTLRKQWDKLTIQRSNNRAKPVGNGKKTVDDYRKNLMGKTHERPDAIDSTADRLD